MTAAFPLARIAALAVLCAAVPVAPAAAAPEQDSVAVAAAGTGVAAEHPGSGDAEAFDLEEAEPAPRPAAAPPARRHALEPLVPALASNPYRLSPGPRPYLHRLAFSPGFGALGSERLFVFRLAYSPNDWLGYEAAVDHNPAKSVHAVHHSLSAIVRRPVPGRLQPFGVLGYGMFMVFPGRSINADPVTKNAVSVGGGLELFIRDDLALRGDLRRVTVFGREKDREGVVAYDYSEPSVALVFYRTLVP